MAQPVAANQDSKTSTTNASSYSGNSVSYPAGAGIVFIVMYHITGSGAAPDPTVTQTTGLQAWTKIATNNSVSGHGVGVYAYIPGSTATDIIKLDFGAYSASGIDFVVTKLTGAYTGGTVADVFPQALVFATGTSTTPSATLGSAPATNSLTIGFAANDGNVAFTAGGSFTKAGETTGHASPNARCAYERDNGTAQTVCDWTITSNAWYAYAIEARSGDATVSPSTVAAVAAVGAATPAAGAGPTPATVAAVAAVDAPATAAGASPTPTTVTAVVAMDAPTPSAGAQVNPNTVVAVTAVDAPTPHADAHPTPSTVTAVTTIDSPTVRGDARPSPATVAAVASIASPSHPELHMFGLTDETDFAFHIAAKLGSNIQVARFVVPRQAFGGDIVIGTVEFDTTSLNDTLITITSNSENAQPLTTVILEAGRSSVEVPIATRSVAVAIDTKLTAVASGSPLSARLLVMPRTVEVSAPPVQSPLYTIPIYKVYLVHPGHSRLGEIDDWLTFAAVLRFNDVSTWSMVLPADSPMTQFLLINPFTIEVVRDGEHLITGPITDRLWHWSKDENTLELNGVDNTAWLERRVVLPDPDGPPYSTNKFDSITGPIETVIRHFVDVNLGPGAKPERRVPGLRLDPDGSRGITVKGKGRFQTVLKLLQDLTTIDATIGFRVVPADDDLIFEVYTVADRSDIARLQPQVGNVDSVEYEQQSAIGNYVYVGGDGSGPSRIFAEGGDSDSIVEFERFEVFVSQTGQDDADVLHQTIDDTLAQNADTRSFTPTVIDNASVQFKRDYDVGDTVLVSIGNVDVKETIREVSIEVTPTDAEVVKPTVGTTGATPAAADVLGAKWVSRLAGRMSDLERG